MSERLFILRSQEITSELPTINPILCTGIAWDFNNELISIATSFALGISNILGALGPKKK